MKKIVRILIPVVLVLAIVLCLAWYLFIYDREFTRDILLQQARQAYARREYATVLQMADRYQGPDPLFDQEWQYLLALCALAQAEQLVGLRDWIAAEPLLENIHRGSIYYRMDMERRRKQLLQQCYENLEQFYREREDFRLAYDYACKLRALQL